METKFSQQLFDEMPVVGIMRNLPVSDIDNIASVYCDAGFTNIEVTMNSTAVEEVISRLTKNYKGKLNVGAGTVCNIGDLEKALAAGAQFIVTPVIDKKVIKRCVESGVPIFCGAYTPTEIYKAWKWGASMVKVFPASKLGAEYMKEVLAPLNQIKLLPTGGVTAANFIDFFKAGAKGVGIGSHLFPADKINDAVKLRDFYQTMVFDYQAFVKTKVAN